MERLYAELVLEDPSGAMQGGADNAGALQRGGKRQGHPGSPTSHRPALSPVSRTRLNAQRSTGKKTQKRNSAEFDENIAGNNSMRISQAKSGA